MIKQTRQVINNSLLCSANDCDRVATYIGRKSKLPLCYQHWYKKGYRHQIGRNIMIESDMIAARKATLSSSRSTKKVKKS